MGKPTQLRPWKARNQVPHRENDWSAKQASNWRDVRLKALACGVPTSRTLVTAEHFVPEHTAQARRYHEEVVQQSGGILYGCDWNAVTCHGVELHGTSVPVESLGKTRQGKSLGLDKTEANNDPATSLTNRATGAAAGATAHGAQKRHWEGQILKNQAR